MGTWLVSGWLLASCGSSAPNVELSTVSSNPDAPVSEQMEHRAAPSPRDPTPEHAHHHGEEEHADEHGHAPRSSVGEGAPPTSLPPIEHAGDDAQRGRPWMGIEMRDEQGAVAVLSVFPGSPAASAGLTAGDELLTIAGEAISRPTDVHAALGPLQVGDRVLVTFRRDGKQRFSRLHLGPKPDSAGLMRDLYVGQAAPSISSLRTLQGSVVPSWPQLQGKVVVLEFWATWCSACRLLQPTLSHWHQRYAASGVHVLSVSAEPPQEVLNALPQLGIPYPVFSDEDESVTRAYRASALPTAFLIDERGVVRDVMIGFDPQQLARFDKQLRRMTGALSPRATPKPASGAPPSPP